MDNKNNYIVVSDDIEFRLVTLEDITKKVNIPSIQRCLDSTHVENILKYWIGSSKGIPEFITPLVIATTPGDKWNLIDGQHRLIALNMFIDFNDKNRDWNKLIPVSFVKCKCNEELRQRFFQVNKSKPINMYGGVSEYEFVKKIKQYMIDNFSQCIKTSNRPRTPNFNIDAFGRAIQNSRSCSRLNGHPSVFIKAFNRLNIYYRNIPRLTFLKVIQRRIDICDKKGIGLYVTAFNRMEWVERVTLVAEGKCPSTIPHVPMNYRPKISKKLRNKVWSKRNDTDRMTGACYVCEEILNRDVMQCGHIISVYHGGCTVISNLEPICSSCNMDMGIINLLDYKKQLDASLSL